MASAIAIYLASQIMQDKVDYNKAIKKYPYLKKDIDSYLKSRGVLEKYT